jgi:hypothetical protein
MKMAGQRLLVAYSSIVSTVLAVILLTGAGPSRPRLFDEIQAHRIDSVEPDGTLRMCGLGARPTVRPALR